MKMRRMDEQCTSNLHFVHYAHVSFKSKRTIDEHGTAKCGRKRGKQKRNYEGHKFTHENLKRTIL